MTTHFGIRRFLPFLVGLLPLHTLALTNNLALTPPMGWNDWNSYQCGISESAVTNNAGVLAANGMKAAGYQYVDIDDGWAGSRDSNGVIQAYSIAGKFPHGIPWLANYVHGLGLKLGVYTDDGTNTCSSCISGATPPKDPGSYLHEYVDALTYGSWGVDYLKDDNCNATGLDGQSLYGRMSDGLMKCGRPILFCLCGGEAGNAKSFQSWSPTVGNYWRTTGDIGSTFASMISHLDPNSTSAYVAGPGRWNDPDMLEVGNGEFASNLIAAQTHFTMWCIMAAPLIAGNNITTMSAGTLQILTNAEAIAVDQDPAGEEGIKVFNSGSSDIWSKALGGDFSTRAVVLLNRATNTSATITCNWTNLDLQPGLATVRDLWAHADLGTFSNSFTATVPAYGSMMLKITGTPPAPPAAGTNYLSDRQPVYAYTGYGTIVPDKSIGGNTITLNGVAYPRGIGVNSRAGVEHDLGGVCSRFQATVGVDDEVGAKGTVIFQVFADGMEIFNSGVMTGGMTAKVVDLDVTGVRRLVLGVGDADDGNSYDHGDWADALVIVTNTQPQVPHAPTGLAASPGNQIGLAWAATVGAASYNVKRATVSGGPYAVIGTSPVAVFTDSNVVSGTTYFYVVSAVSGIGESSNSVETGSAPCTMPAPPANVTTSVSNLAVSVSWTASAGATSYAISRFTSNTPPVIIVSGLTATNYTDTDIAGGMIYFYQVMAANACNQSAPAPFVAANTTAIVTSPSPVWNGASLTTSNWSDIANWNGVSLTPGDALFFDGNLQTDNVNDTLAGSFYSSLIFNPGAGAFVLGGNPVLLGSGIVNNSAASQVIDINLTFSNSVTLNGASNTLYIAAGLTNTLGAPGSTTLTLAGNGTMDNLLGSLYSPGGTNIIATSGSASWTLLDNAASWPMAVPWVFSINSGQFNFGSTTSLPNLTTTTPNNSPSDNQAGTVTGAAGIFNMVGGILTTTARFNTATALNSTGIVNQTGGTLNIGSQFQGANGGSAGEVSLVNLGGGTLNIAGGGGPFYVASRGDGILTISNGATLNCGTLDVSRNASGNTIGSVGVVNLDGGIIVASKVGTATANAQAGLNGVSATFNFNGGTLRMSTNVPSFFQGSTVAPAIPIYAVVKSGGAVIDSNGRTNVFAEPLVHDGTLGSLPDGGLIKNGSGSLIMVSNLTYTGGTTINAGALVLSNSVTLNTSPLLALATGATLDASGRSDGMLSLVGGQKLAGGGEVNGNVTVGPGATVAPGNLSLGSAIATLAFNNNLTLGGGSTTVMKVNRSVSPSNDVLQVAGGLVYGGTLVITNAGPAAWLAGDSFKLFNAAGFSGAFTNLQPAIPAVNLAWNTNTLTNGILSVIARPTPPPVFSSARPQGANVIFTGTNGVPGWQFYLLASTNLTAPMAGWYRAATNGFMPDGSFNFTNPAAPGCGACYYLLLLAP